MVWIGRTRQVLPGSSRTQGTPRQPLGRDEKSGSSMRRACRWTRRAPPLCCDEVDRAIAVRAAEGPASNSPFRRSCVRRGRPPRRSPVHVSASFVGAPFTASTSVAASIGLLRIGPKDRAASSAPISSAPARYATRSFGRRNRAILAKVKPDGCPGIETAASSRSMWRGPRRMSSASTAVVACIRPYPALRIVAAVASNAARSSSTRRIVPCVATGVFVRFATLGARPNPVLRCRSEGGLAPQG